MAMRAKGVNIINKVELKILMGRSRTKGQQRSRDCCCGHT